MYYNIKSLKKVFKIEVILEGYKNLTKSLSFFLAQKNSQIKKFTRHISTVCHIVVKKKKQTKKDLRSDDSASLSQLAYPSLVIATARRGGVPWRGVGVP